MKRRSRIATTMAAQRRKRIALVFEHPTLSGGERSILEVLRRLSRTDFELQGLAPPESALWRALGECGLERSPFERVREPRGAETPAERTATALSRLVDADLIHGNSLSTAQFTGLAGERLGIPAISHVREIERLNPARVGRMARNRTLIAVSEAVRSHLVGQGLDAERIDVVYNGVDLRRLRPGRRPGVVRCQLDIPESAPLIAAIGQISLRKATDVFIRAACELTRRNPSLYALVVGERFSGKAEAVELETDVKEEVRRRGLEERIRFLGWRDDVPAVLRDLDLLVHPARQEPLGRVLLEACALGIPCVATAVGGTEEIIDHERSGWLVLPDDPCELAARVASVLADPAARRRAAVEARRKAVSTFSAERCARRIESIYNRCLRR